MKLNRAILPLAAALMFVPNLAFGSVYLFDWTYGGGTDPVYGSGTMIAASTGTAGVYYIESGSGTRVDSTGTASAGTFAVSFVPCATLGSVCDVHDAGEGGVTADLLFDNILNYNNALGSELDSDGIVLFEPSEPCCKPGPPGTIPLASQYYNVYDASSQEFDPYQYFGRNLSNPFSATLVGPAPEPSVYIPTGLGLLGLVGFGYLRRRQSVR